MTKKTKKCTGESQCDLTKLLKDKTELLNKVESLTKEIETLQGDVLAYKNEITFKNTLLDLTKNAVNESCDMQQAVIEGYKEELQTIKNASLFKLITMRIKGVI